MLTITDVAGNTHHLTNVTQLIRRRAVNGDRKINYAVIPSAKNEHAWDAVDGESTAIFKGEPYIFKQYGENNIGERSIKQVEAIHTFFNTMINSFQYNLHSGSQTFFAALTRVFENTPYDFSIVDSFTAETFQNFGRENCLALFKKVLERYGAEFRIVGNQVYLHREIGEQTNFQYRWKHNIKAIDKQVDTKSLATVIRGYGDTPDDDGNYPLEMEYRSPNEAIYGELHADPIVNENITTTAGMQAAMENALIDEPQLSITLDIAELGLQTVNEGDRGFIIYEPMNIQVSARIVEIIETFAYIERDWRLIKTQVTLSNLRDKLSDITTRLTETSKRVDRLFEGRESLPYNVMPEAVRIASEAINNSLTEVQYPPGAGIVLQDPNDPNLMVRLTSAGIGLSTDGGVTYRSALTGAGIVTNELVAGVIRTNNIQIVGEDDLFYWNGEGLFAYNPTDLTKFVRLNSSGLYIAKGALTLERPDGFKVIDNGMSVYDVNIQAITVPMFHGPGVVEVQKGYSVWMRSRSTSSLDYNQYRFKRDNRYLKVRFRLLASGLNIAHLEIWRDGSLAASASTSVTDEYDPSVLNGSTLTVDMGVPNGQRETFQIRMRSSVDGEDVFAIVSEYWLEG